MKSICHEAYVSRRVVILAALGKSPQYREMTVAWLKLLHRRAIKEYAYFSAELKKSKCFLKEGDPIWDGYVASGSYVSLIPEIIEKLEGKENG